MDSNKIEKNEAEIDIRDVGNFLLGKAWIIALVTVCAALFTFLFTALFVTPTYSSTAKRIVVSGDSNTTSQFTAGQLIVMDSDQIVKSLDFCTVVADRLNNNEYSVPGYDKPFGDFYAEITGVENAKIDASSIYGCISVNKGAKDEKTIVVSFTAITTEPRLSAVIANAVSDYYADYIKGLELEGNDDSNNTLEFPTQVVETARPNNVRTSSGMIRNTLIATAIGFVLSCAVLIVIFIFDDKIKTPDDIQNKLKLNVLGVIPEIESQN
jgi:capsular polysaccharide biosynthesis protein